MVSIVCCLVLKRPDKAGLPSRAFDALSLGVTSTFKRHMDTLRLQLTDDAFLAPSFPLPQLPEQRAFRPIPGLH